jgi:S1-C subfamily serine protease
MHRSRIEKVLAISCLLLWFQSGWAQESPHGYEALLTRIQEAKTTSVFLTAVFRIQDDAERIREVRSSGTGFVIDTSAAPALRVVTNRHVVEMNRHLADEILVKVNLEGATEPALVSATVVGVHDRYDLAVLTLGSPYHLAGDIELKKTKEDRPYFELKTKAFLIERDFATDEDIREGMDIYSIGYPLSLGTGEPQNYPIVRRGIVAQTVPSSRLFLVDGMVNPGNSGSPVVSLVRESSKLLGMVQGNYNYNLQPGGQSDMTNSGLAIVVPASVIKDYVGQLITEGKLKAEW